MICTLSYILPSRVINCCIHYKQSKIPCISIRHCVKRLRMCPVLNVTHQKYERGVHEVSIWQTCISNCWTTCICTRHWAVLRSSNACSLLRCLNKHKMQNRKLTNVCLSSICSTSNAKPWSHSSLHSRAKGTPWNYTNKSFLKWIMKIDRYICNTLIEDLKWYFWERTTLQISGFIC